MDKSFQRKRYKLPELLAELPDCDFIQSLSVEDRAWLEMSDVGLEMWANAAIGEFGALADAAKAAADRSSDSIDKALAFVEVRIPPQTRQS